MKIIIALIGIMLATGAAAQTLDQINAAKKAVVERDAATAVIGSDVAAIGAIDLRLRVVDENGKTVHLRGVPRLSVELKPGDPEFDSVFAAMKAAAQRDVTKADADLAATGIISPKN